MKRWSEIKSEHVEAAGPERVRELGDQMMAEVHGFRLAEARRRRGMTQAQVAERMGVTPGRVSQIERGEVTDLGTEIIGRYVEALGGRLILMARFEDEAIRVG